MSLRVLVLEELKKLESEAVGEAKALFSRVRAAAEGQIAGERAAIIGQVEDALERLEKATSGTTAATSAGEIRAAWDLLKHVL